MDAPSLLQRHLPAPAYRFVCLLEELAGPWAFMLESLRFLPGTVLSLARAGDFSTLLSPSRLQAAWFARFWTWAGPGIRDGGGARVAPLLRGNVRRGVILEKEGEGAAAAAKMDWGRAHPPIRGTVLEIGAGNGMWVPLYAELAGTTTTTTTTTTGSSESEPTVNGGGAGAITRIYGVEPNEGSHGALRGVVRECGLEGVYEVVPVGIEELDRADAARGWDGRVEKGSVDCIVSILCLCSIPNGRANVRELYGYLKEGGTWYAYEHVRCARHKVWWIQWYQAFINLFWPTFIGGCEIRRPIEQWLREAGDWADVDLAQPPDETWSALLPHVLGTLTK